MNVDVADTSAVDDEAFDAFRSNDNDVDDDDEGLDQLEYRRINQNELDGYLYRGEGNANLVISLPSTRSVLRFRKIILENKENGDYGQKRINFEMKFYDEFINGHMGGFAGKPEVIYCPTNDVNDWNIKVESLRPEHRKNNNLYEKLAIKVPDYALFPEYLDNDLTRKSIFCIEIKPKQGFIPEGDRFIPKCTFCLTQFYKLAENKTLQCSDYCPCDLFSGDVNRMKKAIFALVKSPQNNFILFKNGTRVWGDGYHRDELNRLLTECLSSNNKLEDKLSYLITQALLRPLCQPSNNLKKNNSLLKYNHDETSRNNINLIKLNNLIINKKCNFTTGDLPQGCILERIFEMQKLHYSSLNKIYDIYLKNLNVNQTDIFFNDKKNDIIMLRDYLLFSTARDCSILLSFCKIDTCSLSKYPASNIISSQDQNHHFVFNIGVTDLDPKNLDRIEKHLQRTINSINAFASMSSTL